VLRVACCVGTEHAIRDTQHAPRSTQHATAEAPLACSLSPRRLLVRGVNWLGDAVMTTPALQRLREALPEAHITLLTQEKLKPLWQGHPSLDAIIGFEAGEAPWAVARRLRAGDFDSALLLPNSPRAALEVWFARIPQRIGYAAPWRNWLLTRVVPARQGRSQMHKRSAGEVRHLVREAEGDTPSMDPSTVERPLAPFLSPSEKERVAAGRVRGGAASGLQHQLHEYLHLAAAFGASREPLPPRLEVADAEVQKAQQAFLPGVGARPAGAPVTVLGLSPGAQYGPAKRWPAERFAEVARAVSSQVKDCQWLVFGTQAEEGLCDEVARHVGGKVANLAGKTSLRELMALLKLCRVLLTNDSGPMHVAAALGTPVVVPFGSTSAELTGPGLPGDPRHRLLSVAPPCSPCFRRECPIDLRCMSGIRPEMVADAVLQALR